MRKTPSCNAMCPEVPVEGALPRASPVLLVTWLEALAVAVV